MKPRTTEELDTLVAPLARLSERSIAERLGVGRSVVARALARLEGAGRVSRSIGHGRGASRTIPKTAPRLMPHGGALARVGLRAISLRDSPVTTAGAIEAALAVLDRHPEIEDAIEERGSIWRALAAGVEPLTVDEMVSLVMALLVTPSELAIALIEVHGAGAETFVSSFAPLCRVAKPKGARA